ncbi:DUF1761 domain-containing protein [Winogradskya humida]|uniref:DUF1761 domain-containing protein n=1 Tax=Winogradskya humida TaxID=113566 RepID=A0ABQ4A499_9ACTN|nr:DUF1761 domain-containing protein [Actinoplanes humidus]GIE25676.1 hypothetical protein Ahu01nite_087780 [Actinoplanes humidus]
MFNVLGDINWLAVLAGFAAFALLGGLWFALLFPKQYNHSLGRPADAQPIRSPLFLAGPPLCALIITITTATLIQALHITTYADALVFALIAGIGYLVANTTTIAINPNFPHPLRYAAISGGYNVIGLVLVSLLNVAIS